MASQLQPLAAPQRDASAAEVLRLLVAVVGKLDSMQASLDSVQRTASNNATLLAALAAARPASPPPSPPPPPPRAPSPTAVTLLALALVALSHRAVRRAAHAAARRTPVGAPLCGGLAAAAVLAGCQAMEAARAVPYVGPACVPCPRAAREAAWRCLLLSSAAVPLVVGARIAK
ncbi:hypothetical protein AB1Y20_004687 [Prymnesium parvum]|uniref:Uncharacterized protein n=1 Tax=Prymnesium parvum TaxID=97485 RepID=A0AB34IY92_PRYPA